MEKCEELLRLAAKKFQGTLEENPKLVIRILAGITTDLTTQLIELTGKDAGETGGPAILRAVTAEIDTGRLNEIMEPDWNLEQRKAAADLAISGIAMALCTYVKDLV